MAGTVEVESIMDGADALVQIGDAQNASDITSTGIVKINALYNVTDGAGPQVVVYGDCEGDIHIGHNAAQGVGRVHKNCGITVKGDLTGDIISGNATYPDVVMAGDIVLEGNGSGLISFKQIGDDFTCEGFCGSVTLGNAATDEFSGILKTDELNVDVTFRKFSGGVESKSGTGAGLAFLNGTITTKEEFLSAGLIRIDDFDADANIVINENAVQVISEGDITIYDELAGDVAITGDYKGDISAAGSGGMASTASLAISGKLGNLGDIEIDNDLDGLLAIGGNLEGTVQVGGDVDGTIDVNAKHDGQILVEGYINGTVDVAQRTGDTSLIRAIAGLGAGAEILINTSAGAYNANGDMWFGSTDDVLCTTNPVFCSYDSVEFDGCIRIYESSGASDGDLNGDITIRGCHDDDDDIVIDVDGTVYGNVIVDTHGPSCNGIAPEWDPQLECPIP